MKHLIKLSNFFIFSIVIILFFIINPQKKFSLQLSSILSGDAKELYTLSATFNQSNQLFIAIKGFDRSHLSTLQKIEKELLSFSYINEKTQLNNKEYQDYKEKYKFYLNNLNYNSNDEVNLEEKISKIYNQILSSPIYFNIDKKDPLSLLQKEIPSADIKIKDGHLILPKYGYLKILSIDSTIDEKSKIELYNNLQSILKNNKEIKAFSPLFYYIENSAKIQSDVNSIIYLSLFVMSILYLVLLRNFYLFINVTFTLVTSVVVGEILITYIFSEVSIIALAFSIAVTSVSIDYMFHHYLHNYYEQKIKFNKSVFLGYLTTILSFVVISFIDFPLVQQIALFSIISLSVAYIHFAFIYPFLSITYKEPYRIKNLTKIVRLNGVTIIIISLCIMIISTNYLKFDFNMKNLDYQNISLIEDEYFFQSKLHQTEKSPILIMGNNIDELIVNTKKIKNIDSKANIPLSSLFSKDGFLKKQKMINHFKFGLLKENLNIVSKRIGFKDNYFDNSYSKEQLFPLYPEYSLQYINRLGYRLIYDKNRYVTYAVVNKTKLKDILLFDFTQNIDAKDIFANSLKKVYKDLLLYGILTVLLILFILVLTTKKKFFNAVTYILVPSSIILLYGIFVPLNIMHIFMMFIVIAIGIDYGIYMNEKNLSRNSSLAIIYSLISTFAGFGVLIISEVNSLNSIAISAIIGIVSILFLLFFQDNSNT